jgi:hypothetical protein
METKIDEIANRIYRISTYIPEIAPPAGFNMNQFLVMADEPLLFHTGPRALFPFVAEAVAGVTPVESLRWITFGHVEADECGSVNMWLAAAPDATFTFARDHFHTEERIRATGLSYTFLRSSMYLDYVPLLVGEDGVIRGPAGDGRVACVARDDVADVAAAVLTSTEHDGRTYDVTGPAAFTIIEAAAELSRATGRTITYENETLEQARASRAGSGAEAWEIEGWVTSYAAIATGEMDVVSDTVREVAGHVPISLAELLKGAS